MRTRNDKYYEEKIKEIKQAKRELGSISSHEYGERDEETGHRRNNKQIKVIKEDLKKERRSLKRSQRQYVDRHIDEEVFKYFNK